MNENVAVKEDAGLVVYGASDDLIEIDGCITEEFNIHDDDEGDYLAFSTGVVLRIRYSGTGVWRITPIIGADLVSIMQAPEDDEENYTDRAFLHGVPTWAVQGSGFARAAAKVAQ